MKTIPLLVISMALSLMQASQQQDLLRDLQSPDWTVRARSLTQLLSSDSALDSPAVRAGLVRLGKLENNVIDEAYRAGDGVSKRLGEEYSEYYSTLLIDALTATAARGDIAALEVLARGSYNPDSRLAKSLASYGDLVLSTIIELTGSDIAPKRWNGVAVAGEMLRLNESSGLRADLSPHSVARAKLTIRHVALTDPESVSRRWAVRALGVARDQDSLALLRHIAATDADDGRGSKAAVDVSVRAEAMRAITAIEKANMR